MLFEPTDDQEMLADTLTRFAADVLKPQATAWSQAGKAPMEVFQGLRDLGVFGLELPESMGGAGFGRVEWVQAVEALAVGDGGVALALVGHCVASSLLAEAGEYVSTVEKMAAGEELATVGWVDVRGNALEAREENDALVLNGAKQAVAITEHATWLLLRARLGEQDGLALVKADAAGLTTGTPAKGLGLRSAGLAEAVLVDVKISKSAWFGAEALKRGTVHLDLGMAALAVGLGAASLGEGARYGMERKQFGQPIAMFQANQFKLADMATENDGARLLVMRAAHSCNLREVDMARVFAAESATKAADHALQLHGGYGYTEEFPVERLYRDAQFSSALYRTGDMLRSEIARELLGEV